MRKAMKVAEAMSASLESIPGTDPLYEAIEAILEVPYSILPVVDGAGVYIGIISPLDFFRRYFPFHGGRPYPLVSRTLEEAKRRVIARPEHVLVQNAVFGFEVGVGINGLVDTRLAAVFILAIPVPAELGLWVNGRGETPLIIDAVSCESLTEGSHVG